MARWYLMGTRMLSFYGWLAAYQLAFPTDRVVLGQPLWLWLWLHTASLQVSLIASRTCSALALLPACMEPWVVRLCNILESAQFNR